MRYLSHSTFTYFRLCVLLLAALMLYFISPIAQIAHAASNDGWKENIVLTGNFHGTFTLNSNTSHIFEAENAAPGDKWTGDITIQNLADEPMEVALLSIASELEDLALYNALTLDIQTDGVTVYSGSYGKTPNQISPHYELSSGESMVLNVTVTFPAHYGNEMIGKHMDSTWTFEARYPEPGSEPSKPSEPSEQPSELPSTKPSEDLSEHPSDKPSGKPTGVQTGNDLSESNTTPIIYGIVAISCLSAIVVTWLRVRAEKRRSNG